MKPRDIFLVLLIMMIWGGNFVAMRIGALEIPPYFLLGLRLTVAAITLVWFAKSPHGIIIPLLGISFVMCILHFGLALIGLQKVDAGTGSLAMQASVPFAAVLAWVFFREPFGWPCITGVIAAFAGLTVISGVPQLQNHSNMFLVMLISALCFSIATIQIRRLGSIDFMSLNAWVCIFSAPMAFLVSWVFESGQWDALDIAQPTTLMGILYMGLVASVFGQGLWYRLLPRYQTNQIMPFTLLVPIFGTVFGILCLNETLNWHLIIGATMTITGVAIIILNVPEKAKPKVSRAQRRSDDKWRS